MTVAFDIIFTISCASNFGGLAAPLLLQSALGFRTTGDLACPNGHLALSPDDGDMSTSLMTCGATWLKLDC